MGSSNKRDAAAHRDREAEPLLPFSGHDEMERGITQRTLPQSFIELNIADLPLSGVHIIEASAGTGKTYSIVRIYLRLLLKIGESHPRGAAQRILAVTFTNAAAAELRSRLRQILQNGRAYLLDTQPGEPDPDTSYHKKDPLLEQILRDRSKSREYLTIIEHALEEFDRAPIHTIHSFVYRSLQEFSFESNLTFHPRLVEDAKDLILQCIHDEWRRTTIQATPPFLQMMVDHGYSLKDFESTIIHALRKGAAEIEAPHKKASFSEVEGYRLITERLQLCWNEKKETFKEEIQSAIHKKILNGSKYRASSVGKELEEISNAIAMLPSIPAEKKLKSFVKYTGARLEDGCNRGQKNPFDSHPVPTLLEEYLREVNIYSRCFYSAWLSLLSGAYGNIKKSLQKEKERSNLLTYDDLLTRFLEGISLPQESLLLRKLQTLYDAALIDEFQDTDQNQWNIFRKIFQGNGKALFLIGDPKQSIYRFRGADLRIYEKARSVSSGSHTISRNFRSTPGILAAIEALFQVKNHTTLFPESGGPFLHQGIDFIHVESGREVLPELDGQLQGLYSIPLEMILLKEKNGSSAVSRSLIDLSSRIVNLLNLGVRAGSIAVLVRSHREASLVQQSLRQSGVVCVIRSSVSLFQTGEALDLLRILQAAVTPHDRRHLHTAMTTESAGFTESDLLDPSKMDKAFQAMVWFGHRREKNGFLPAFRHWLHSMGITQHLLQLRDGERRYTNLIHLAEILQKENHPSLMRDLHSLKQHIGNNSSGEEEWQIRLESDEEAVQVITVHAAKGLEYDIIMLPFSWGFGTSRDAEDSIYFEETPSDSGEDLLYRAIPGEWRHMQEGGDRIGVMKEQMRNENLSEELRLLYVALTRAKKKLFLYHRYHVNRTVSAMNWLISAQISTPDGQRVETDLQMLVNSSQGSIALSPLLEEEVLFTTHSRKQITLVEPPETPEERPYRTLSSYTSIMRHAAEERDGRDLDAHTMEKWLDSPFAMHDSSQIKKVESALDIFAFPAGAAAGIVLHSILEEIDFTWPGEKIAVIVKESLRKNNYQEKWNDCVTGWIINIINYPLLPTHHPEKNNSGSAYATPIHLNSITMQQRISELEFHIPVPANRDLKEGLKQKKLSAPIKGMLESGEFILKRGYLNGFIDLIFESAGKYYLVDWKSNHLGSNPENYTQGKLEEVMLEDGYTLQYHLYTLALHRHLKSTLSDYEYEKDMGGVFYLFLRGMNHHDHPGSGVYFDRPDGSTIAWLESLFFPGEVIA